MKRVMLTRPDYRGHSFTRSVASPEEIKKSPAGIPPSSSLFREEREGGTLQGAAGQQGKISVDQIMEMANHLEAAERQRLLDHLALKRTPEIDSARDVEMWSVAIYESLQKALGASSGAMGGPMLVKRAVGATSSWAPVEKFMQASKLADLQVRERLLVYSMLAELLVKHARHVASKSGAPLSPKLVANCTASISGVFESAFPGYLQAGLAQIVARQLAISGTAGWVPT